MEVWTNLISSLGFPLAACIALGFFVYKMWQKQSEATDKMTKQFTETVERLTASHHEEMSGIQQALTENTIVMNKLINRLDGIKEDVN